MSKYVAGPGGESAALLRFEERLAILARAKLLPVGVEQRDYLKSALPVNIFTSSLSFSFSHAGLLPQMFLAPCQLTITLASDYLRMSSPHADAN